MGSDTECPRDIAINMFVPAAITPGGYGAQMKPALIKRYVDEQPLMSSVESVIASGVSNLRRGRGAAGWPGLPGP